MNDDCHGVNVLCGNCDPGGISGTQLVVNRLSPEPVPIMTLLILDTSKSAGYAVFDSFLKEHCHDQPSDTSKRLIDCRNRR